MPRAAAAPQAPPDRSPHTALEAACARSPEQKIVLELNNLFLRKA